MADTAIYTACYGGFDTLHPQVRQALPADWVCFTDQEHLEAPPPWQVIVDPSRFEHPRMAAKWHKFLPHKSLPDYKKTIWIDANMEVDSMHFAEGALDSRHDGIAVWRHPQRNCVYDEAKASVHLAPAKYQNTLILDQARHYRRTRYPSRAGLYACGTLARDNSRRIQLLGEEWLKECVKWSYQDQVSFPVVCRRLGIEPGVFPFPQVTDRSLSNPWLRIHPHNSDR